MVKALGYAAKHSFSRLKPFEFDREPADEGEVEIEILYCGVCHSDIHQVKNEWSNTVYPCVPGHEIVGRVKTASSSGKFTEGQLVGVGCMIDSCRECEPCRDGEEQYCESNNSWLATYNGPMIPAEKSAGEHNIYGRDNTYGGYSDSIVVREEYVLTIPDGLDPAAAAPILCAGVTTWSPMRYWEVEEGDKVGIIGLGGLGHMAVQIAVALGAEVTVFTTNEDKAGAAKALGATAIEFEKDVKKQQAQLAVLAGTFDFMMSTIPEKHDINPFILLLKRDATLVVVGALEPMAPVNNQAVAFHRRNVTGSLIGSIAETQDVLDFCAKHGIAPEIEIIPIQDVNSAYKKVEKGDVRFRYVIDMATLAEDRD